RGKTGSAAMNERSATALTIGPEQVAAPGDAVTHAANDASAPKRVVISLRDVRKSYTSANGEKIEVLRGVNLDVEAGSFNVVRGESGSGKTSLLRILGMLDTDFTGDYLFAGDSLKAKPDWYRDELRANNIGFVFQEGQLFGHMRIRENITLPVRLQGAAEERRSVRAKIEKLAPAFFTKEELEKGILSNRPSHVSGGQKQRAAIMRSVVNRPALLLADEPTASLDEERKHEILKLLVSLCEAGHTVVVVSHDKVFYQSGRQLELANGVLREIAPGDVKSTVELPVRRPAG